MSTETHRCEGRLRGFTGGQCDSRATVECEGKWYCGRHNPTRVAPPADAKYVWELWHSSLFRTPHVTRYVLVKMHDKGGCTVLRYGKPTIIKPMSGKRFYTDEAAVMTALRTWHANALESARNNVAELERVANDPQRGILIEEVRGEPISPKNLKL